jgi:hypothetical protein
MKKWRQEARQELTSNKHCARVDASTDVLLATGYCAVLEINSHEM